MQHNRLFYYIQNYIKLLIPRFVYRMQLKRILTAIPASQLTDIRLRVEYYNKLQTAQTLPKSATQNKDFRFPKKLKTYFFDLYTYSKYFSPNYSFAYEFGDITTVPTHPTIVKSRPITEHHENSVLMKLNKIRHFVWHPDTIPFTNKQNMLLGRMSVYQQNRINFLEQYFNHPLCNVGQINTRGGNAHHVVPWMDIREQLQYKFILCLEGNDVASNLKWVMASNSIAVMPKPRYESWFMEGCLEPDYHYICIADDYSNLEEKLMYYIHNPQAAENIRIHANEYVKPFQDAKREDIISLLVLQKYFDLTQK